MGMCCKIFEEFHIIYFQIHLPCKKCIFKESFAKVVLIARILQDFCKNCFSCELGKWNFMNENKGLLVLGSENDWQKNGIKQKPKPRKKYREKIVLEPKVKI